MKKFCILLLLSVPFLLQYCTSSKKIAKVPNVTYAANVQPIILANCSPCHIPAKGGRIKPFDNYTAVKAGMDSILSRVNRNPGQKGFMPFKHSKLADSTLNVLAKFKSDGLLEN